MMQKQRAGECDGAEQSIPGWRLRNQELLCALALALALAPAPVLCAQALALALALALCTLAPAGRCHHDRN